MKKIFVVLAAMFLLAIMACSGGGDGGNSNSSESASSTKISISGNISAPSGIAPSSLTVVTLGKETPVSSQGNFSTDVYKDGVAVVSAVPAGKSFGLMNVVVTNSTDNIVAASVNKGTKGSGVQLDAQTTAVSLVFLSPYFITNDPTVTSTLLPIIESDPKVAVLATVIEKVFTSSDPLNEPEYKQALIDAVQSVIDTLTTQKQSVAASKTASPGVTILHVPKISTFKSLTKAASLSPTTYYADQDYITVKAGTSGTGYGVTVESRNVGSIDWIAEAMEIDSTQFTSFVDFQAKASNKRTIYKDERQDVLGKLNAPAKSIFRYFDLIQEGFDWAFEYSFGKKALDQIPISSTKDGVYLIRSYSGATGQIIDSGEQVFIMSKVPNGETMNDAALATNMLMVCLETTSIFIDIRDLSIPTLLEAGMTAYHDEVSLVNNPTIKDLMSISVSVIKAMVEKGSEKFLKNGLLDMLKKSTDLIKAVISLPAEVSNTGKVFDRLLQMITSATPMETSFVVVGNPFPSPQTNIYTVSGKVTHNGTGLAGVIVTLTGANSASDTTDSSGDYSFTDRANGNYTVTPSLTGYSFSPSSTAVNVSGADKPNINFTATASTAPKYSMSGTIHVGSNSGVALSGATVSIAGLTATTDGTGYFYIAGISAGTYAFSVSKSGYDTYTNSAYYIGSDQTGLNFYLTQSGTSGDYTSANIGTLKYVPAGSFQRDATSTNISTVSAFRMSQYEITRAQFLAIIETDPSDATYSSGTSDPVQMVTWYDAVEFCNKLSIAEGLTPVYTITGRTPATGYPITDASVTPTWANNGYRLPTEMEWMWAAMGATAGATGYLKAFAGSTGSNAIGDYAWYYGNSALTTHPVGTKLPNELGIYDMSGNVWEWCWDFLGEYPTGTQTNYRGAGADRVIRGGGWSIDASNAAVAIRSCYYPSYQGNIIGFRVVRP